MKNIKEIVLKCHNELMEERGLKKDSDISLTMTRENGIDSLGIVTLILELEEELDIELDSYIAEIRNSKTLSELIDIIRKVIS